MKLSLRQVARALDSPLETIERWVRQGRIPIRRNGEEYIFETTILEKWAAQHKLPFSLPEKVEHCNPPHLVETLVESMRLGGVHYGVEGNDASSALAAAAAKVPGLSSNNRTELYDRLVERETLASTGIGKGIAIPHPRTPLSHPIEHSQITTCFLDTPIEFNAVDDKPVLIFFILLSPSVKNHLHLISRLSFCLRNNEFTNFLRQMPHPQDIFQQIAAFECTLDKDG